MGLLSFAKDAGRKVGLFGGREAAATEAAQEAVSAANVRKEEKNETHDGFARSLEAQIASLGLDVDGLSIKYRPFAATITGRAATTADQERIIIAVGNTLGVAEVNDQLTVVNPAPPAVYHTVEKGDSLSKISLAQYGVIHLYDVIFEANKPMLQHEDEIFEGQVLRIPPVTAPTHTVAKGETLGAIAKHWYGDAKRYTTIFEANKDKLSSPDAIEVGQALTIPVGTP